MAMERTSTIAPRCLSDEFALANGNAVFRLVWTPPLSAGDLQDLRDWIALIERRLSRFVVDSNSSEAA